MKPGKATVIGCGVMGLTSAIRLIESGFEARIIAKDLPPNTTSDTAGAIWYPYRCLPEDKALDWGSKTLGHYYKMMDQPESGVFPVQFTEYLPEKSLNPWWKSAVRDFGRVSPGNIPDIYQDGYLFEVPFIDTSLYMKWLMNRFKMLGGNIIQAKLSSITEAGYDSDFIINCSGVGAKTLVGDTKIYPVQGQVIKAVGENNGGYYLDQGGELSLCYVLPRKNDIVLGGTAVEHAMSRKPDPRVTEQILRRVKKLDPSLKIDKIVEVVVGLRPARNEVRLEKEEIDGKTIIHNYGHGGAGFTLCWGCADEVVKLVKMEL